MKMLRHFTLMVGMILLAGLAFTQPRAPKAPSTPHEHFAARLELTEQQKDQVEAIRMAQMKEMVDSRNEADVAVAKLKIAMTKDNPNLKDIDALTATINKIKSQQLESRVATALEIRQLLNEEQKVKFDMMVGELINRAPRMPRQVRKHELHQKSRKG